jgi:hypothetical protein
MMGINVRIKASCLAHAFKTDKAPLGWSEALQQLNISQIYFASATVISATPAAD